MRKEACVGGPLLHLHINGNGDSNGAIRGAAVIKAGGEGAVTKAAGATMAHGLLPRRAGDGSQHH